VTEVTLPSEDDVRGYLSSLSNWGRWGEGVDGLRGTLNFITPAEIIAAAASVERGIAVSCSLPVEYAPEPDGRDAQGHLIPRATPFPVRYMIAMEGVHDPPSSQRIHPMDGFLIEPHGQLITHIDAPCHTVLDGTLYNGVPATEALSESGAMLGDMELVTDGIVARGVLLDVPAMLGRRWLEDDEVVLPEHLDRCEQEQGVEVRPGDCLLVRTGYRARNLHGLRTGPGFSRPGLQAACLPWLHEREIALLAADVAIDCVPHGYDTLGLPVHTVGMWALGLWLIDNCYLERLSATCAELDRYSFFFNVAPLVLRGGTGSPVNPLAIF
jgi:kynurenine formamidase